MISDVPPSIELARARRNRRRTSTSASSASSRTASRSASQKRVVTVDTAFGNGADYIVVGRPIRDADSPREAAEAIQATIAKAVS